MKRLLSFCILGLSLLSFGALGGQCSTLFEPQQRFELVGENLVDGDQLTLTIGGYVVNYTVNANSSAADQWPYFLALEANNTISESYARVGVFYSGYNPTQSATGNWVDVTDANAQVSLEKNGSDYSSQLLSETIPTPVYSGSRFIPSWTKQFVSGALSTFVSFSNISSEDVTVEIVLFDQDGNQYDESTESGTQLTLAVPNVITGHPVSTQGAVVPAGKTGMLKIASGGSGKFGYGYIKWSSSTCLDAALTAQVTKHILMSTRLSATDILINGGHAF